jgi:hypothetical protein
MTTLHNIDCVPRVTKRYPGRDDTNVISTYYYALIDCNTALVAIFSTKKQKNDKVVNDFMNGMYRRMFSHLGSCY